MSMRAKPKKPPALDRLLAKPETTAFGDQLAGDLADHAKHMMLSDDARLANDVMQIYAGALAVMLATIRDSNVEEVIVGHTRQIIHAIQEARSAVAEGRT